MLSISSYSLDPTLLIRNNMDRSPIAPAPPALASSRFSAPKRKRDDGTMLPTSGPTGLSIIEAPETRRFNSPLPASANDTRKPGTKMGRFQDMTAKGGAGTKRSLDNIDLNDLDDDDDDDDEGGGGKRKYANKRNATSTGRRKIDIEYIDDKSKRHVSFTKRKAGLMKKAYELSTLTGTNCLVLVVSETGLVYTYATPGLKPVIAHEDGKAVIAASLRGELKIDDNEYAPAPSKRTKSASKSTEPELEMQEDHHADLMIDDQHDDALPPLPLPELGHIDPTQHQMFDDDNGMMDPSLRYLGDYNSLFPSSAGSSAGLLPASLPPLPFPPNAESSGSHQQHQQHPYSLPPSITSQPLASTSSFGPTPTTTAYSRGVAEAEAAHQQAFASYNSRSQFGIINGRPVPSAVALAAGTHGQQPHGAHEFGEAARSWRPPSFNELDESMAGGGPRQQEGNMAERKKAWREEAMRALSEAIESRTIPSFIRAHSLAHKASLAIPPPRNSVPTSLIGIECTLDHFRVMCESSAIKSLDFLGSATKAFLNTYLTSTHSYTPKMVNEAKQHLTLFFDFLEGHGLITAQEQEALSSFDAPSGAASTPLIATDESIIHGAAAVEHSHVGGNGPLFAEAENEEDDAARGAEVEKALTEWSAECKVKFKWVGHAMMSGEDAFQNRRLMAPTYSSRTDPCAAEQVANVQGWFEVYRVRGNYCLLKERELIGDADTNLLLSPFKVRFPRSLTPKIKIEDAVWLTLRRLEPKESERAELVNGGQTGNRGGSWVPIDSGTFHPTTSSSSNIESDIDPTSYADELESMLLEAGAAPSEEDQVKIKEHKDVLGMLERASDRLAEGELSDC